MAGGSKPASITLTLNSGPFKDSLKENEKAVKSFGEQSSKALKTAFADGIKGAGSAVSGLFSTIKSGVSMIAGIGGAMGISELVRAATVTAGVYRGMAAGVKLGTGEAADFRDMMAQGSAAAQKWGKDVDEIGAAMNRVRKETGDLDFAKKSADTIAMASRASHESIDSIAGLSSVLHKSFKTTDDQLQNTLATVLSLSNKGGVGFDELSAGLSRFGVVAKQSGKLANEAGLSKFLGLVGAGASGAQGMGRNIAGATSLIEQLSANSPQRAMLLQKGGLSGYGTGPYGGLDPWSQSLKGKDEIELIKVMVAQMGGKKDRMAMTFEGDQLAFLSDIGAVYKKAFDETKGGEMKKRQAGFDAIDAAIKKAAQGAVDGADLQKMANEAMKDGPAKMQAAIEKMRAAFMKPEIAAAIDKLADALPHFAELVTKVVGFAMEHPVAAGAAVVGGTAAKGFAGAAMDSVFAAGGKIAGGYIETALGIGGKSAGTAVAGALAEGGAAAGTKAGASMLASAAPWALVAGAAVGAAIYQAVQLKKEVSSEASATKKDKGGSSPLWREFLHDIGAMDDHVYQKQWEDAVGMQSGSDSRLEYGRALDAKEKRATHAADEEAMGFSFDADRIASGGRSLNEDGPRLFGPRAEFVDKPKAPERSAEDGRLLAEMLASRELKVRVMNPDQIRDSSGPGTPRPGYIPRQ